MHKSSLRRACAALAAVTSLALGVTACGGTTKNDVAADSGSAAAGGTAD
ncbi:rhamnose ABC transporter substrate-binding protein, partial [Streptomyces adustus]|nr:rhamnose ABC transporter substrate-binding protein [Streptomyces adustus]